MKNQQPAPPEASPNSVFSRIISKPALKVRQGLLRISLGALLAVGALTSPQQLRAASQTWTNAPVDNTWANTNNWVGKAVPGDINITSANTVNADIATFNAPLLGGIGGAGNPILPDDATVINGRSRRVAGITFDTTNCGPYVIWSPSPAVITDGASTLTTGYLYVSHNSAIRINDSVTNSQAVIIPMLVNLPSSTAGSFNLVNNSTNPGVSLTINSITHAGATTRATTFILDGTNSSVNVVTNLSEGPGNNTGGFTKQGTCSWIIAGPGTFPVGSPININNGTLIVQDPGAFGAVTTTAVVTNATLRIDGVNLTTPTINLRNGGTILMKGIGIVNGITMSAIAGNNATLATTNASDILTVGNNVNTLTGGAIDSLLHIAGPGTVLLSQPANYAGKWSVDAGTNQLGSQGALGTGPNLNINASAVFDVSPIGATSYFLDTKALSANGTGTAVGSTAATISADPAGTVDFVSRPITLTFVPTGFTGDSGHPALYCSRGTLAFHGNAITVNNASGSPLGLGTYQLVQQTSGNISSSGAFVTLMTGSGLVAGAIAEINAVGGNLNLVVTAYTPKPLVWSGNDPLVPATWDRQVTTNWLSGATPSTFNIYDGVTFNATGSAHPSVTLSSVMQPSTLVVDTTANDYTFTGPGQIAGATSLVKVNTGGALNLQTANTYSGGTIISNGLVKLGIDEGISSTGPAGVNDVTLLSPAVFDLNNFSNTVNGLNGNGTIDITGGSTSTLNIGFNGDSGTFTGPIQNTSGTLGIVKLGTGTETLTASNSFVGPTIINAGTLRVTNVNALGAGNSPVTINGGTLDMQTSLIVSNLNGAGFVINSSVVTNTLNIQTDSVYNGVISGKIRVQVNAGTLRLNAANTYSNGTILAAGTGLTIGGGAANFAANPGPGTVIASNNVTFSQPNTANGGSTTLSPTVNTVDGATATFTSANTQNSYGNQFTGSALATNVFRGGNMSISGALSFSNFLGTVIVTNGGVRWFNASAGGDNTTFIFQGPTGGGFARDNVDIIHLGALFGNGAITAPSSSSPATYWIGGKGNDSEYSGIITGSNNIVKVGAGKLVLDGFTNAVLAGDGVTFTNYQYGPAISYLNNTVISNGVLALASPNDFSGSQNIIVASPNALLDATSMGYVTNFTDNNSQPNSAIVTNGILTIAPFNLAGAAQTLGGNGSVKANGIVNMGTINPGFAAQGGVLQAGTLVLSNSLTVLANATNYTDISDDPSGLIAPSDLLKVQGDIGFVGPSFIGIGAANGTFVPGKYTLIKYSGNLTNESGIVPNGPISNVTLGGALPATTRATLLISNAPGEIDLGVVSLNVSNLVWVGGPDPVNNLTTNVWDVVTSYSWTNSGSGTPMQYFQLDNVLFNDTSTNQNVVLQGTVAPSSITVNSGSNYLFGGSSSIIGDTALTKAGTGILTLTNGANTFNGGTVINAGVIRAGFESANNQSDLAFGIGPISVNTGAELRFGGGGTTVHFVTNAITVNGGIIKAVDGVQHLTNSTVTVGASGATLQTIFSAKNLVLDSPLNGAGNLTVSSGTNIAAGQVILNNPTNALSGTVTIVTNGNLALAGFAGLSNSPAIDVQLGGILDVSGRSNRTWAVVSGQTLKGNGAIRGALNSQLSAAAGSTIAPGVAGAIGTLTVTNFGVTTNFTLLTLNGTLSMDISRAAVPNNSDRIVNVNGTNVFGGTLNVNNLGAALQAGDTFTLFTSAVNNGAFTTVNLPALTGTLTWNNTLNLNGKITVVAPVTPPTVSPGITNFSLAGANITLNGTNSQSGATYYLLSTTNVALPVAQWKTIATNVAAGTTFSFTGTNSVTVGKPQQFYMLSSTNFNP